MDRGEKLKLTAFDRGRYRPRSETFGPVFGLRVFNIERFPGGEKGPQISAAVSQRFLIEHFLKTLWMLAGKIPKDCATFYNFMGKYTVDPNQSLILEKVRVYLTFTVH